MKKIKICGITEDRLLEVYTDRKGKIKVKANSKRFLALCLSASMVFGSVLPASASDGNIKQTTEQTVQEKQEKEEKTEQKEQKGTKTEEKAEVKEDADNVQEAQDSKSEEKKESSAASDVQDTHGEQEEIKNSTSTEKNADKQADATGDTAEEKTSEESTKEKQDKKETADTRKEENKADSTEKKEQDKPEEFEIASCTASIEEDRILVTIDTDCTSYDGIYIGKKEDKDKSSYVKGRKKKNGGFVFELELDVSDNGQKIPVVLHKAGEKGTKAESWYLPEKQQYFTISHVDTETADEVQNTEENSNTAEPGNATEADSAEPVKNGEEPVTVQTGEQTVDAAITTLAAPADGIYDTTAETGAAMFKVVAVQLTSQNGAMKAKITLSGTGYDYLYMGTKEEAGKAPQSSWIPVCGTVTYTDADGARKTGYQYEIPVEDLDKAMQVASHSERQGVWYDRTITISSANLKKQEVQMVDGTYTTTAETGAAMFKIVAVRITVKNGVKTAKITLSGTGYDYLYVGTAAEATGAPQDRLCGIVGSEQYTDPETGETKTGYQYDIPLSAFDTQIQIASHSQKQNKWYDRQVMFSSANLKLVSADNPGGTTPSDPSKPGTPVTPTKPTTPTTPGGTDTVDKDGNHTITNIPKNDNKEEKESKYESDLSGSTKKVNAATTLADGVYTPDRFSWSGGSGRVSISCNKVTVKNGQAYATIVFSSSAYPYVKANGNKYTGSHGAGTSSFTIPVELNKNNTIIGMTTKMSANHEIKYKIFVYLAAASAGGADGAAGNTDKENPASKDSLISTGNKKLDDKAPEIVGLTYASETKVEHAKYFRMYHYENDITLLEIDMSADTARADKQAETGSAASDTTEAENTAQAQTDTETTENTAVSEEQLAEAGTQTKSKEDTSIDVYKGNIIKYLIYPEGAEIPAGLEDDVVLVQKPAGKAYVADEKALATLKQLKLTDKITALGFDETTCTDADMKQALADGKVSFGGTWEEPDLKTLLTTECDLAVLPSAFLPREASTDGMSVEEQETRLEDTVQKYALLHIPMIVDRSADEQTDEAKAEWAMVYGALFDCEKTAQTLLK